VKKLYRRHLAGKDERKEPMIAGKMPAIPRLSGIFSQTLKGRYES